MNWEQLKFIILLALGRDIAKSKRESNMQ